MQKLKILFLIIAGLVPLSASAATTAAVRDCDSNAVVYCGANTPSQLVQKLQNGDGRHSAASLQATMAAQGITVTQLQSADLKNGYVYRDGHVTADGKRVATGAMSFGRQNISGSTQAGELWKRPTSVSLQSERLPAFVYMPNGQFAWAVIESCGNPVIATPVPKPAVTQKVVTQPVVQQVVVQQVVAQQPVLTKTGASDPVSTPLIPLGVLAGAAAWHHRSRLRLFTSLSNK